MSLFYVDTSAALKLLAEQTHSKAFAAFYDTNTNASCSDITGATSGAIVSDGTTINAAN